MITFVLPMPNFRIIKPSPLLAPYVHHYWSLSAGHGVPAGDRIIPDGSISLIFHRADPLKIPDHRTFQPQTFVSGITTNYSDVVSLGTLNMLVVVFRPMGCAPFLRMPLDEFRNTNISVEDTGDVELRELSDQVMNEFSDDRTVARIEQFLLSRLAIHQGHYHHRRIKAAIGAINENINTTVSEASAIACLSTRQFNRIFSEQVGVRPKEFMRIVRFQRALYTLQVDRKLPYVALAAANGYFDQAHMIREFREFSGYTPVEYLAACPPHSDYFS